MICYGISNVIRYKTFVSIAILVHIIWIFRLIKVSLSIVSIPLYQMAKSVFWCKSIGNYIISIYLYAWYNWIFTVEHISWSSMVSSPEPCIINNNISTIYLDHKSRFHFLNIRIVSSSNSCKDIMHNSGILCWSGISLLTPF
jgi:hypothetical protein